MTFLEDMQVHEQAPAANRGGRPRSSGRGKMRQLECEACGLKMYATSATGLANVGLPTCGCGGAFYVPKIADRLAIDFGACVDELLKLERAPRRELLTAAGWSRDEISGFNSHYDLEREPGIGRGAHVCQYDGPGGCQVFTAGQFCAEHEGTLHVKRFRGAR